MSGFDYDVVTIGSGFGGSTAALRAAEKGYRVGVMESGKRWKDEDTRRPTGIVDDLRTRCRAVRLSVVTEGRKTADCSFTSSACNRKSSRK